MQRQKAVSAYFTSKQILPFAFAERYTANRYHLSSFRLSDSISQTIYRQVGASGQTVADLVLLDCPHGILGTK